MWLPKKNILVLCLSLASVIICFSQENDYKKNTDSITAKVKRITGCTYYISGTDIDRQIIKDHEIALKDPFFEEKLKDTYHTLAGCFVFLADGQESDNRGFIGIYRIKTDSIIWQSVLLSDDFSSRGRVAETRELNKDKKVEMIIVQSGGSTGSVEILWIFNWDGAKGKLITRTDEDNQSDIIVSGEYYELKDVDNDGIYEIQGMDSDYNKTLMYSWNGHLYGDWGKSSKYLLKGKKK